VPRPSRFAAPVFRQPPINDETAYFRAKIVECLFGAVRHLRMRIEALERMFDEADRKRLRQCLTVIEGGRR
jgi:hypothetical protein